MTAADPASPDGELGAVGLDADSEDGRADAPPLVVRSSGGTVTLPPGPVYRIGRDPDADVAVDAPVVSWRHAELSATAGQWLIQDAGSTNGTFCGGSHVSRMQITGTVQIRLGHPEDGPLLTCSVPDAAAADPDAAGPVPGTHAATALWVGHPLADRQPTGITRVLDLPLRIGRADDNDVVIKDLQVSRRHAELRDLSGGRFQLTDTGSSNGTFVNGQRITTTVVTEADVIGIGAATFRLAGNELREFDAAEGVLLSARGLTVTLPSGKVLLDHVSFPLPERCLLGVIGPSGAGKSTLLGALTGMRPATSGSVLYDGRDLYANYAELRHRIGLVPQENILHTQLSARRGLSYAAELRFPQDTTAPERSRRVDEVLGELSLARHADTRTGSLSGGQQKRVNVALELLTKPSLLFLDEPTSGLDPGLDKSVMEMLAQLAKDGRTVMVVTHSVANLASCDRLLVLVPGGKVAYFGTPADGLRHFGHDDWAEVFQDFEAQPDRDWSRRLPPLRLLRPLHQRPAAGPGRRRGAARRRRGARCRRSAAAPSRPARPAVHPGPQVPVGHRLRP